MTNSNESHNSTAQYSRWSGGKDQYADEEIEELWETHGEDTEIFRCEGCEEGVHFGGKGWNEQTASYVRYGPYFVCAECIVNCIDLPEIPWGFVDDE